jgi:hypothetical protein
MLRNGFSRELFSGKTLSGIILFLFAGYWLFTLGMAFLPAAMARYLPLPSMVYRAFIKQDWRLFSSTSGYNRKVMLVFPSKQPGALPDTFQLWERIVALKKKAAPLNNSEDAADHLFFQVVNGLERQVDDGKERWFDRIPDQSDSFYICRSSAEIAADTSSASSFRSILVYGRSVFLGTGRQLPYGPCEMIVTRDFIPPLQPRAESWHSGQRQFTFKSFIQLR